ncbi:MAG: VCBS repeat-containing protein, partial [Bacteroidetes bacterium]|nr:VCBS repeat-containing protein [Bacteroidota bacterium]
MKKLFSIILLLPVLLFAQTTVKEVLNFNTSQFDVSDANRPWNSSTNHVRGVTSAVDLDGDGKNEILAVDYSNNGRIHVIEYNNGVLELVWSSPVNLFDSNPNSTPRWVQFGDLDNDGKKEIIFPAGPRYDGAIQVFEFTGTDNDYGTESIIDFKKDLLAHLGAGDFRMDRETATVYDFDGDGQSELITANGGDQKVYILSINGDAPGFASWQVEGGDPAVHPNNRFSGGSWWQSIPVDYDGDGVKEIVNHYWNFYGFWSIEPTGTDTYTYPGVATGVEGPQYFEYTKGINEDAVAYMGTHAADVDGDGNEEIFSSFYVGGGNAYNNRVALIDLPTSASGVEVWTGD